MVNLADVFEALSDEIKTYDPDIRFTALEIGARPSEEGEPFYKVLDYFPGSEIIGFEVDEDVCRDMNARARGGTKYFPYAVGAKTERRKFYETNHPMCGSLYKPNEKLLRLFNNLEVAYLKNEVQVDTIDLDTFVKENSVGSIDFIKIDVQGAELDIFRGGETTIKDTVFIVSEVEFIHHYENQPLFGDVSDFLSKNGFIFHKFSKFGGRSLKPLVLNNDPNFASWHIWSDAAFIRNILDIDKLTSRQILKLSFLAALYTSIDVTYFCLDAHDKKFSTNFRKVFADTL